MAPEVTFNQVFGISGCSIASDELKVIVQGKESDEDRLGGAQIPIRELSLGAVEEKTFPLRPTDSKGHVDPDDHPNGSILLRFHVGKLDDSPFVASPWKAVIHQATIEIASARDLPIANSKPPNPCVRASVYGVFNTQAQRTRTIESDANPTWDEEMIFFVTDLRNEKMTVSVYDEGLDDDERIGTLLFVLTDFPVSSTPSQKEYPIKGPKREAGRLTVRVAIEQITLEAAASEEVQEAKPEAEDTNCIWTWGTYSSSYSTNFTSATSPSEPLSDLKDDEEQYHLHGDVPIPDEPITAKVWKYYRITGRIASASNLIRGGETGTDSYVTIVLSGKGGEKGREFKTKTTRGSAAPGYKSEGFDYRRARKGWAFVVTVWQKGRKPEKKTFPIGSGRLPIKDIPDGKSVQTVALGRPDLLPSLGWEIGSAFGSVVVELDKQ
jgi:hypothetical protein